MDWLLANCYRYCYRETGAHLEATGLLWRRKVPGGAAGLQNQSGGRKVPGGFDSLPSPPDITVNRHALAVKTACRICQASSWIRLRCSSLRMLSA
jgi:hypothetical protein